MSQPPAEPAGGGDGLALGPSTRDEAGHRAELTVAADSPWLAGHFPDHPVLPAIAHLAVAVRLHRACGEPGTLSGIESLRFSEPVRPGDQLVAHLTACDEQTRARFRLERCADGVEVSSGSLMWGSPTADEVADAPEGGDASAAVTAELPHAGPSRLLDRVVVLRDGQVAGHGRVPAVHAAARDGRAPAFLAIEVAAQAAAQVPLARDGQRAAGDAETAASEAAAGDSRPRLGYLVRLREVRLARAEIEVDSPLLAHVDLAGLTGPLARFDFVVALPGGEPIASGSLTTWDLAAER